MDADTDDPAWGPAEEGKMRALGSESPLPPGLEERTVEALRARGMLRARTPRPRQAQMWAAAAMLALVAGTAGFALGRARPAVAAAEASSPRFLLLLHEDASYQAPAGEVAHRERVAEYAGWARELARRGQLVGGDELGDGGWMMTVSQGDSPLVAGGDRIAGYFILRAPDAAAALALGRGCPHLRHGGRIELRAIRSG